MSMKPFTMLIIGIEIKSSALPFNLSDPKVLPYIEGDPNRKYDLSMFFGEQSDEVWIGKHLHTVDPEDQKDFNLPIEYFNCREKVADSIKGAFGIDVDDEDISVHLFTTWN